MTLQRKPLRSNLNSANNINKYLNIAFMVKMQYTGTSNWELMEVRSILHILLTLILRLEVQYKPKRLHKDQESRLNLKDQLLPRSRNTWKNIKWHRKASTSKPMPPLKQKWNNNKSIVAGINRVTEQRVFQKGTPLVKIHKLKRAARRGECRWRMFLVKTLRIVSTRNLAATKTERVNLGQRGSHLRIIVWKVKGQCSTMKKFSRKENKSSRNKAGSLLSKPEVMCT